MEEAGSKSSRRKTHLKNVLSKLQANDRTHAFTIAMKRGFLES